jgi:hypothetical protein
MAELAALPGVIARGLSEDAALVSRTFLAEDVMLERQVLGTPLLALALLMAGCAPTIRTTTFLSQLPAPRPADHPVRIYYSKLPACPFDEIGLLSASRPHLLVSEADVQAGLIDQVRRMGGDALVNVTQHSEVSGSGEYVGTTAALQGTVVRFTEPTCDEPTSPVADLE